MQREIVHYQSGKAKKYCDLGLFSVLALFLNTQSAFAIDDCLLGLWNADLDAMAELISETEPKGETIFMGGATTMDISDPASFIVSVDDVTFRQAVSGSEVVLNMNGTNTGIVVADDDIISIVVETFDLLTEVIVAGNPMTFPGKPADAEPETFNGSYVCTETRLDLSIDFAGPDRSQGSPPMPHSWTRAAQ